jgi:hypothetical protein
MKNNNIFIKDYIGCLVITCGGLILLYLLICLLASFLRLELCYMKISSLAIRVVFIFNCFFTLYVTNDIRKDERKEL